MRVAASSRPAFSNDVDYKKSKLHTMKYLPTKDHIRRKIAPVRNSPKLPLNFAKKVK